ncbi:MAG: hypothetical protein LBR38_04715 [Synergistaceae bacterium]|jgi:acyl carrier protein|nr:hypothetical protein [Synergistaceae bacterium]
MTTNEKLALLADAIEAEPGVLAPDTELASLETWDSMAKLSVLAMFIANFEREITPDAVRGFVTVGDVLAEMGEE